MSVRLREWFYVGLITFSLFGAIEMCLRIFAPQTSHTMWLESGKTAAVKSPTGTHRLRPNNRYRNRNPEFDVLYEINSEGMRDRSTYLDRDRESSAVRILLLGDSFTYGQGVQYEEMWSRLLETNLIQRGLHVEVVKAGVPAYDTRSELEYLEELYPLYQPDYVMVGFLPNDVFTNQLIRSSGTTTNLKERGRERVKQVTHGVKKKARLDIVTAAKRLVLGSDRFYVEIYKRTHRAKYFSTPLNDAVRTQLEITEQLFGQIHQFCTDRQSELIVVSIPQQFQVLYMASGLSESAVNVHRYDDVLGALGKKLGFLWIPTLEMFADDYGVNGIDQYYRLDGHFTPYGNAILSDWLSQEVYSIIEKSGRESG